MKMVTRARRLNILLALALLLGLLPLIPMGGTETALANPGKMVWSVITTPAPNQPGNIIVSPSEINSIAIGGDAITFYAIDVANSKLYKSVDGGATWPTSLMLNNSLNTAGAKLPVWNIAMAPDDVNFVVAITDSDNVTPQGPKEVFISIDGGANWQRAMAGMPLSIVANEYISCVDISLPYGGGQRDIAIGTRVAPGAGTGKVWVFKTQGSNMGWNDQALIPIGDIAAIKFSPTYFGDSSLVAVSATVTGTFLNLGFRDVVSNTTTWNNSPGYPVPVFHAAFPGTSSPTASQIITADLELPADFVGSDPGVLRRYYVNTDATLAGVQSGVYRIDNDQVFRIKPPTDGRISSIAYFGIYTGGNLLAGEVNATSSSSSLVNVWRCIDPINNPPAWLKSDQYKSPTGGANSNYANAQVAWNPDGAKAYCGTSSANLSAGGTGGAADTTKWPFALRTSYALDESAFSISPYSPQYQFLFDNANKAPDIEGGEYLEPDWINRYGANPTLRCRCSGGT